MGHAVMGARILSFLGAFFNLVYWREHFALGHLQRARRNGR
jgi:hypothetical protein